MHWTKDSPSLEGLYWYRTAPGNGVLMKVDDYQDLQQGVTRTFVAFPQLPYEWISNPGFNVACLHGEWAAACEDGDADQPNVANELPP